MKRWLRRIVIAAALIAVVAGLLFEGATRVGRGRLGGEPFYQGRPASYWANEIERWQTQAPSWQLFRHYERHPMSPPWIGSMLPDPAWPRLLDGDPDALAVLQALRQHPSTEIQDWARIGIERIDNDERGACKINHPSVIVTVQLYEVDEAFYKEVAKAKWLSTADLEEMDRVFLEQPDKQRAGESLFDQLGKKKLFLEEKKIKLEMGREELLISLTKEIKCLPSPAQLRKGQKGPQTIEVGMSLRVQVGLAGGYRFVRLKFLEKDTQLDGIDKATVFDVREVAADVEVPYIRESTLSSMRQLPDGGSALLALQYRSDDAKQKGRWLVARIEPRIYMEEEERMIRSQQDK